MEDEHFRTIRSHDPQDGQGDTQRCEDPPQSKLTMKRRARTIWSLALVCSLSFVGQVHWRPAQFTVIAEIKTDAPARLQLRYNRGYGNRQEGIAPRDITAPGDFTRVRFPIEVNSAQGLRLVNLGFGHSLDIRSLILKPLRSAARTFTAAQLAPNSPNTSETRISQVGDIIHVDSNGIEPLVLHIAPGSRFPASRLAELLQWIFFIPLSGAALGLVWMFWQPATNRSWNSSRLRTVVVGTLVAGYFAASFANLNGSSTALWRYYADREMPTAGLLLGSPKEVRSDEWLIQTPWIFSQAARTPAFNASNPNVGSDVTPLVTNLPVRHWSTWFRPQMWPFFLLGSERAFAFYWNFKLFSLLLSAFLFFGVLTGGKTLLDLGGAVLISFSPFLQWWWSTPTCLPEMLAMVFLGLWLVAVVFRARRPWQIPIAAAGFVIAAENFIFCCYPRFQLPLAYLAVTLLVAGFVTRPKPSDSRAFRLICITLAILLIGLITWCWWREVASIIRITSLLSYPGQVRFTGGGFAWHRFFDPFLEFSMTGDHYPEQLENACEATGFLFLAPFLVVPVVRDAVRKRNDLLVIAPLALAMLVMVFMVCGVPSWLANISGWSYVYSGRANLVVGVATIIVLVRFLSRGRRDNGGRIAAFFVAGWFLLLLSVLQATNIRLGHFESGPTVVATALFFALVAACIWKRSISAAYLLLIIPLLYATALVNPVARGVPGITDSRVLNWLSELHRRDPEGNWIVLGDTLRAQLFPDFLKACGVQVRGGMRCNPDYEMLRILDPTNQHRSLTDRYAWVHFHIADVETPVFTAAEGLAYDIKIPLSTALLDRLDVKHILEVDMPGERQPLEHFHHVDARDGCRVLERD